MKAPHNYTRGVAPSGKWKEELLKYLAKIFNCRTFIETGTCEASTLLAVHDSFLQCYSIELSDYYYNKSVERVGKAQASNITLIHGNSGIELRKLLSNFKTYSPAYPILFWLDSHYSGGLTANEGDPLPEEIKAIMELSPDSLVVIDDEPNDERVKGLINDEWITEFRTGIVFLYRKGLYQIPEFE